MSDATVIRKLNEMFVVQTTVLDIYESLGETTESDELARKFSDFSGVAKELLATINDLVDGLGGELIDNVEEISLDLKTWVENLADTATFSGDEVVRDVLEAFVVESINHRNWSVMKVLAEESGDNRLEAAKGAEGRVDESRGWLKSQLKELGLREMR